MTRFNLHRKALIRGVSVLLLLRIIRLLFLIFLFLKIRQILSNARYTKVTGTLSTFLCLRCQLSPPSSFPE